MADPTIYANLARFFETKMKPNQSRRKEIKRILQKQYRLMVSGSSALPIDQIN
jgi:hypothetical protein